MKIKKFILNRLFNERQRKVIWNAVLFSEHTYRRRGNVEMAANVRQVINETSTAFGVKETFTRQEVDEIMKRTGEQVANDIQKVVGEKIKKAFEDGRRAGIKETCDHARDIINRIKENTPDAGALVAGGVIDTKKCEQCDHKDSCGTLKMIREFEQETAEENAGNAEDDAEDSAEGKSQGEESAEAEQAGEQADKPEAE